MTTLRETLADHPPQETSCDAGWIEGCWCGWELPRRVSNEEGWAAYFAHLESVVLAWVGARLAGAREVVAETAWRAAADFGEARDEGPRGYVFDHQAEWVIAAIRDALGVPVAPAGGEVAPGAAGDAGGARKPDCEACPFLGCDGCEAEAARRANGEAK